MLQNQAVEEGTFCLKSNFQTWKDHASNNMETVFKPNLKFKKNHAAITLNAKHSSL